MVNPPITICPFSVYGRRLKFPKPNILSIWREGNEGLEPNEDEDFNQGGDDDGWAETQRLETVDANLVEYLRSRV